MEENELLKIGVSSMEYDRAMRYSASTFLNQPKIEISKIKIYSEPELLEDILYSGNNEKYLIRDHFDKFGHWIGISNDDQEKKSIIFGCTDDCIFNFLHQRKMIVLSTGFMPPFGFLINRIIPEDVTIVEQIVSKIVSYHVGIDNKYFFGLENLMWYLSGSFIKWIELLSRHNPIQIMTLYLDENSKFVDLNDLSKATWLIWVVKSPLLPGLSIRAMNIFGMNNVLKVHMALYKSRKMSRIDNKEAEKYSQQAFTAIYICKFFWSEL